MKFLSFESRITITQAIAIALMAAISGHIISGAGLKLLGIAYRSYNFLDFMIRALIEHIKMLG
jgi:hypothetical protein